MLLRQEFFKFLNIFGIVESKADSLATVPSGTSGFLIITLQRLWNIVMNHEAHVRFVYTHSESNGSHDDVGLLHQELILIGNPGFLVQTCMIWEGIDAVYLKQLCKLLHFTSAETVNDTGFSFMLVNKANDLLVDIHFRSYLIKQVGSVKAFFIYFGVIHTQSFLDIVLYLRCGGSSKCNYRYIGDFIDDKLQIAVFRPEIMSPFGNTVSLINCYEGNLNLFQEIKIFFLDERFRRHI